MPSFIHLLSFGLLAAGGNLLGGFLISRRRVADKAGLKSLLALGAGFMLAAVLLEVIPEIVAQWPDRAGTAMSLVLAGYLLIQLAEHTIAPHFHFGEEKHKEEMRRRGVATSAIIALSIHTFFDGVAIASGLLTNLRLGLLLSIAILLHKIPEGFTVASIVLSAGRSLNSARLATALIALTTFAGIIFVTLASPAIKYTLPFAAGVTLYVAASDLIPEVNSSGRARTSLLVFAGVALFYGAHLLLHSALD